MGDMYPPPPPPPEAFDHETAKVVDEAKRIQLKEGMSSSGLLAGIRHDVVTIVVLVVTLPWRLAKGVVNIVMWPFRR